MLYGRYTFSNLFQDDAVLPNFIYAFDQMGRLGIGKRVAAGGKATFFLKEVTVFDEIVYSKCTRENYTKKSGRNWRQTRK